MSIAEKTLQLKQDFDAVYEAGKVAGGGYDTGFEEGYQDARQTFWHALQQGGNKTNYEAFFLGSYWNDDSFKPVYDLNPTNVKQMFYYTSITNLKQNLIDCGVVLDTSKADYFTQMFQQSKVTHLPTIDMSKAVNVSHFCSYTPVVEIEKIISHANIPWSNSFTNCKDLEKIRIEGEIGSNGLSFVNSPKLTHESLMSIINALKDFSTLRIYENAQDIMGNEAQWNLGLSGLAEGQTLAVDFWPLEWGGASEEPLLNKAEQTVHTINVNGIGERLGVHYSTDYWVNPDEYTFNLMLFDDGVDESTGVPFLMVYRFLQHKETGEISDYDWGDGDRIIVYEKYAAQTCTLTLGATNLAKLTDAEKMQATEKGWELKQ